MKGARCSQREDCSLGRFRFAGWRWAALPVILLMASCGTETPATQPAPAPSAAPKIVSFYPGQPAVAPGDQAQVCYGVENAQSVRLEPAVAEIRPLTTKCFWFKPTGTLKLTLIATAASGEEARETIDITVRSGAPPSTSSAVPAESGSGSGIIETFIATATSISPGGGSTLCYVLREPAAVRLNPSSGELGSDLKKCVLVRPKQTTRYTLTANAGGRSDSVSVTVRVQ